ncbi:hypothetical protein RD792_014794 [Penstemon davidsonii]|uniref:SUN domain-containing protein n=1 Tax=Penstemon davidsonii TaxID=160366 RepID=A0ABR0CQB7_9LAMI|nr:hypothetical protein RD792_014794 [Penstemon davidsonii]
MATFSITDNHISRARHRAVENAGGYNDDGVTKFTTGDTRIMKDAREPKADIRPSKSRNSPWVFKILGLLAFLFCLYQGIQWLGNSGGGKTTMEEKFVKTTAMLQVQLNEVDKKLEDLISSIRKIEKNGEEADLKLKALDVRTTEILEKKKFMYGGLRTEEELGELIVEEINRKVRKDNGFDGDAVREIVLEEIERHAADGGVGMVDYALALGGAMVLKHSDPYGGWRWGICSVNRYGVCAQAQRMITPSFGEPGQCLALDGGNGFVEIKLSTAIFPEAVTLEHVDESVTYSTKTAPRKCNVSGWLRGHYLTGVKVDTKKKFLLTEFTYDLGKRNIQTYKVVESASSNLIDTVRLDVISNYGGAQPVGRYTKFRIKGAKERRKYIYTFAELGFARRYVQL